MSSDRQALEHLVIKERLHELEMAYCRGVDRRDRELLRSIFFDDATEDHGEMFHGPVDQFVDWVFDEFLGQFEITAHYVLNEWYRVVDDTHAESETHRVSYHRPHDSIAEQRFAACRTFNRYERRDGVWKIAHRGVVRDWIVDAPQTVDLLAGHLVMPLSTYGPTDRSYTDIPHFTRGPLPS